MLRAVLTSRITAGLCAPVGIQEVATTDSATQFGKGTHCGSTTAWEWGLQETSYCD